MRTSPPESDSTDGRHFECRFRDLRSVARKRREASALHGAARRIGAIPGRERDANTLSREAEILDSEWRQQLAALQAHGGGAPRKAEQ